MSNSDKHNHDPQPNAIFGRGAGTIKGGQHLLYPQDTPQANLLLTMLNRAGIAEESLVTAPAHLLKCKQQSAATKRTDRWSKYENNKSGSSQTTGN